MSDCLFCKIINKEIPSQAVFENEHVYAFRDINPEASTHVLVVPKKHVDSLATATAEDLDALGQLMLACKEVAKAENVDQSGYRVVINTNKDAGQVIFHVHAHLMGGRSFGWPPG